MDRKTTGYTVQGPDGKQRSTRNEDKFINDASIITKTDASEDVVNKLKNNAQLHERLLYSTGVRLAMHKSFWTLVTYNWSGGGGYN